MKRIALAIIAAAYVLAAAYTDVHGQGGGGLYVLAAVCATLSISQLAKD